MASIGSDIINQIGGGSGVNTTKLVDDLVGLQRAPEEQRLDTREERIDAQVSGYGLLRSAIDEFDSSLETLANGDTFNAKQASISDNSQVAVNALNPEAVAGTYRLNVSQVAQSQSLSSGTFASRDAEVGTGSLTLRFGDWDGDTFNLEAEGATIEIDDSNNSLSGLRDAINEAGIGAQASIVGQEGSYQLLLTSPTGAQRELEITATEDGEAPGLAAFNFNETEKSFEQNQAGQDAILSVNGLEVTRSTNSIDDVIDGVEFDLLNANSAEDITINITEDRAMAETAIRDFVEAYNTFYEEARRLQDNERDEEGQGSLNNDSLASNLMRSVRSTISAAVPGLDQGFSSLASLGIRTRLDGTLEFADDGLSTDFNEVFESQFSAVRDLFVPSLESDNARLSATSFGNRTQAGEYDVEITQDATRGQLIADAANVPVEFTDKDYSFNIAVDGTESGTITLPENTYNSLDDVATELQTLINSDSALRNAGSKINVSVQGDVLVFESDAYGRESSVAITGVGDDAGELGLSEAVGETGKDVAGTFNGEEGFGYGRILRGALRSPAEGLVVDTGSADIGTTGTINFSRGFAANLSSTLDTYVRSSGLISERESTLKDDRVDVSEARATMERRSEAYRERLENQFRQMEQIVRGLNSTGDFLDGLNDRLPFTAKN